MISRFQVEMLICVSFRIAKQNINGRSIRRGAEISLKRIRDPAMGGFEGADTGGTLRQRRGGNWNSRSSDRSRCVVMPRP